LEEPPDFFSYAAAADAAADSRNLLAERRLSRVFDREAARAARP
jgi:hypothetical protein